MSRRQLFLVALASLLLVSAAACDRSGGSDVDARPQRTEAALKGNRDRPPCDDLDAMIKRVQRGYYPFRSPDIVFIARKPHYVGTAAMPVHSGPWDYLAEVPLMAYGPGFIKPGTYEEEGTIADLAPTAAELIGYEDWPKRDGRVLEEMLQPDAPQPKLILNIVWDGGGWNALDVHPDSWPYLKELMDKGALYRNFDIGSSPSVTPPIHTNLGTGAFPARHGAVSLKMRAPDYEQIDPFGRLDGSRLKVTTLADEYDRARDNVPVTGMLGSVSWHLGMIGHGAALEGADHDPVTLIGQKTGVGTTNDDVYQQIDVTDADKLLELGADLDARDGKRDERWMGHPTTTPEELHSTPAVSHYEQWVLERFIDAHDFGADDVSDLLYVNFKTSDIAGHKYGMTSKETGAAFEAQDENLRKLVRFLDRKVGEREWVIFLTADHGQMPYPHESGAWPIYGGELARDLNEVFDKTDDDVKLVRSVGAAGVYVQLDALDENDTNLWKMARWIAGYTVGENLKEGEKMRKGFEGREDELLMDAVLSKKRVVAVTCRED